MRITWFTENTLNSNFSTQFCSMCARLCLKIYFFVFIYVSSFACVTSLYRFDSNFIAIWSQATAKIPHTGKSLKKWRKCKHNLILLICPLDIINFRFFVVSECLLSCSRCPENVSLFIWMSNDVYSINQQIFLRYSCFVLKWL